MIFSIKAIRCYTLLFILMVFIIAVPETYAEIREDTINRVEAASTSMHELMNITDKGIPRSLMERIYGIAIIPNTLKAGFIVGGSYGLGVVSAKDKEGEWGNPCFITLTSGSIGFQAGAESSNIVLVFNSIKSMQELINGSFKLGANASIAAGPVGRRSEVATDFSAEVLSYSVTKGIFAGVSLEGAVISIDKEANDLFYKDNYKDKTLSAYQILFDSSSWQVDPSAVSLKEVLKKYSK